MSSVTSVVWPTPCSHCQHSEGPAAEGRAEADPVEGGNAPPDGGRRQETPPAPAPSALLPRLAACLTSVVSAGGFFEAHFKAWRQPRPGAQGEQWVHGEPHLSAPCGQACGPQGGAGCPRLGTVSTGRRGDPTALRPVPSVVPRHLTARCLQLQCAPETPPHPALRLLDHVPMSTRSKGGLGGFSRRRRRPLGQAAISQ